MWQKALLGALVGGLIGGGIGWKTRQSDHASAPKTRAVDRNREKPERAWQTADFLKHIQQVAAQSSDGQLNPLANRLKDWSDAEVKAAVEECAKTPELLLPVNAQNLPALLFAEWMRRDLDGALEWLNAIPSPLLKSRFVASMHQGWPRERAMEGFDFIVKNRLLFQFDGGTKSEIIQSALQQCATSGVAPVEQFLTTLEAEHMDVRSYDAVKFPANFDFAGLMNSEWMGDRWASGKARPFLAAWYKQDRDAVFDWLLEARGASSLKEVAEMNAGNYRDNFKWFGTKMDRLDANQRGELMAAMSERWVQSPPTVTMTLQGVQDEGVRDELRRVGLQALYHGYAHAVVPLLETISDPAARVQLLATLERSETLTGSSTRVFPMYSPGQEEEHLRQKLTEWKASPEQVEAIVSRFKPKS